MKKRPRIFLTVVCIICVLLITLLILGARYRNDQSNKLDKINDQNVALINRINKELDLPYSKPIIVTVYDPADFNANLIVGKLQKGDKILLYLSSNEAVIFRPKADKIIDIVPARAVLNTNAKN